MVSAVCRVFRVAPWPTREDGGTAAASARRTSGHLPDGRLCAWLGPLQGARRRPAFDSELLVRLDLHLMADPLLPLARVGRGGRCSVRGSRENQLVWANALIASLASRIPLRRPRRWADYLQVVPFMDGGHGWNHPSTTADPTPLARVGLGARGAASCGTVVPRRPPWEVVWGDQRKNMQTAGGISRTRGSICSGS